MIDYPLLFAVFASITVLLALILKVRLHVFASLLIASIVVGGVAGLNAQEIMSTTQEGVGNTLGFVATAASLVVPLLSDITNNLQLACIVISIALGATFISHVNDRGFCLVKEYLGINEKQRFKTWAIMAGILSMSGFVFVCAISLLL